MDQILEVADSSFKYILLGFNFLTLLVIYVHKRKNKPPRQHHILLVTAHPDDQCMFFRPTLRSIVNEYYVHILCLSCGKTKRQEQLNEASKYLGIHKVTCLDDDKLKDGLKQKWCQETIREHIIDYVKQNEIKAIFTFDNYGISQHPNHIAIYNSLKQLQRIPKLKNREQQNDEPKTIKIYYLESVNIIRKYIGCLQGIFTLLRTYSWHNILFIDSYKCMQIHKSQFTWYRKLWVFFSRYSYINTYQQKRICIQ